MTDRLGEFARSYWVVIVAALVMAAAWGTTTAQLAWVGRTVDTVNTKLDVALPTIAANAATVAVTRTDIADLRERLHALEACH